MPTVQELAVRLSRDAAESLARTVSAMPDDKFTWRVMDEGRAALHQTLECGGANRFVARLLEERALPQPTSREEIERINHEFNTQEKALEYLRSGTELLVAAIQAFRSVHLDDTIELPFRGGMTKTFAEIMLMGYWNMTYHLGQINFIQTLYGDREMR
jgi:uncharacterized damage-inducible protein DinB